MTFVDWAIVAGYVVVAFLIGLSFARKAGKGTAEFFVAGRSLPWWIAGTSMVATTFASDTPIFISAMVREQGIYANWLWWSWIIGIMGATFFFAPLWRRSRAITEIEFLRHRYDATRTMTGLRIFKATYDGIFVNCVVMATVTLAMSKLMAVILGIPADHAIDLPVLGAAPTIALLLAGLGLVAVGYTVLSGLYGVVYTDLIQFVLAMVGAIALAIIVLMDVSERGGLAASIEAAGADTTTLRLFPEFGMNLETATFAILLTVGWWIHTPSSGYLVQRMLATRSETDALLSVYWFAFCHFVLRSWPWIVAGVASVIYFPTMVDPELSYPKMIDHLMPIGLKGIMVASILAAFMSTLDTHMNWGSSYMVNDIYRPYLVRDREPRHYVTAARVCMLAARARGGAARDASVRRVRRSEVHRGNGRRDRVPPHRALVLVAGQRVVGDLGHDLLAHRGQRAAAAHARSARGGLVRGAAADQHVGGSGDGDRRYAAHLARRPHEADHRLLRAHAHRRPRLGEGAPPARPREGALLVEGERDLLRGEHRAAHLPAARHRLPDLRRLGDVHRDAGDHRHFDRADKEALAGGVGTGAALRRGRGRGQRAPRGRLKRARRRRRKRTDAGAARDDHVPVRQECSTLSELVSPVRTTRSRMDSRSSRTPGIRRRAFLLQPPPGGRKRDSVPLSLAKCQARASDARVVARNRASLHEGCFAFNLLIQ